jgi:arylsulfatase A
MMPLRNSRSRIVGFTVAALVLLLSLSAKGAKQPNIIYILADDLGYGDISLFGQERFKTPNIDRIAKEGIRFTQHYSGSTVCAPSRSCLMTGLHTGHTPIRGNFEIRPEGQKPMPAETVTVAELLEKEGYVTGAFGKWGLGFPGSEGDPTKQGFDAFFGYNCQRIAHNYYPYHVWENENKLILTGNEGRQEGVYAPEMIQERTLEFIEANRDKPFFCYVPHVIPHAEMFAPESYMERFRGKYMPEKNFDGTDDGPNYRDGGYGSQPESHAAFVAMVTMLDDHVGQILDKVDELGIADNTIILFTSDNGPHMEGGADPEYFNSNGPLRGYKRDLYEGGIRVPLLARWPGKIKAGLFADGLRLGGNQDAERHRWRFLRADAFAFRQAAGAFVFVLGFP